MVADFDGDNAVISEEAMKVDGTVIQCLLRGGGQITQAFSSGQLGLD